MNHARRVIAAAVAGSAAVAYIGAGRSRQLRWDATDTELRTEPSWPVRERYAYSRPWAPYLLEPVQLISFVMTRRMLRGIKERAENSALSTAPRRPGS